MPDQSTLAIEARWPAWHPERMELYSLNPTNGVSASIMLEETEPAYEINFVDIFNNQRSAAEILLLTFNTRFFAVMVPGGPERQPLALLESGVSARYLAEKTGGVIPATAVAR